MSKFKLLSQVVTLQTAQSLANAGVCGGLCACAVVVHTTKRLVSLILLKGFLIDSLYILCQMKIFNRLIMCMDTVAVLPHAHIHSPHTHTMEYVYAAMF